MIDHSERALRFRLAYGGPYGSWAQLWVRGVCDHDIVRCVHGDEINARWGRRRACMVCGRSLKGELPEFCWFTGEDH